MINLSVVIITLNEEKNISRCIDSVKKVANEIIVVDSFSTDNTKEICNRYPNVTFIQRKWDGYGKAKNYGNSIALNKYILSLDADEALSEELTQSILKAKENFSGCYCFNRLTNYCGKWIRYSGWYPDRKVRIFPKDEISWNEDLVHENVLPKNHALHYLKGDLLHYSINSISEHIGSLNKYSDLGALDAFNKNKGSNLLRVIISPFFKFLKLYIFKAGFLDGYYGFIISINTAYATFSKYAKLLDLHLKKEKRN